MKKNHCYSASFDLKTEGLFREAEFLGQGNNGIVYKVPENKVIKLFYEEKVWYDEAYILTRTKRSAFFPKLYEKGRFYIVREMVEGIQLDKYIKKNGLNFELTKNIYELLEEFKRLKFKKIDSRCKDIYGSNDLKITLIDPKKYYRRNIEFPRHLMKGFLKLEVLNDFYIYMKQINEEKTREWIKLFQLYMEKELN